MDGQNTLYKKLYVKTVTEEKEGFKIFVFEDGHNIVYKAGQYLTLVRLQGGEEVRRSYSIISSPKMNEPLAIGVKRVVNGAFSRWLVDHVQPGNGVLTTGNGGFFILPEDVQACQQLFFFAAGSGITPVYSLVRTALHTYPHLKIVLVYSNASREKALFLSALQALQQEFPLRFVPEFLFSNNADLAKARLHRDLIFSFLEKYVGDAKQQTLFYVCGPESYMRLCTYTLLESGFRPSQVKKENFYFSTAAKRDVSPPDKSDYSVNLRLGSKEYRFTVHYPDSILQAARKTGLMLPYSCEAGRYGNCVALCTKGTVWHSYNEVLTEKETGRGLILTCVGHPQGGDVELVI